MRRRPPQRGHRRTSTSNTRRIRAAQESLPAPEEGRPRGLGGEGLGAGPPPSAASRLERGDHGGAQLGAGNRYILLRDRRKSPFTTAGTPCTAREPA